MTDKQPILNGAYYGPSIPPPPAPKQTYHRPGRGGGIGCCCGCLFNCLLSLICKLIFTVVVIIGIAVLIVWLIFRPNKVKFHVTEATLTQFNYTNNTLRYDLALNMTVRNPNKRIGIYYDRIEARAFYEDQRFDTQFPSPFYQGHKNTSVLSPVFKGQQLLLLGAQELSDFNEDKNDGVYNIDVKLYLRLRFKFGVFKVGKFKPKIKCDLKVPLKTIGTSAAGVFETTRCDVDF
ncbi:Late embryogenesis abundant protein [Quillaja saponaria]|uniref:Late embryogenesis abundant protein n=1 Tax=Quillaja saponaria TaxID=32244 RepID=A0AAD7Q7B6_QUISA|nr:Late embryogenesis abundant protein [Quillaja saponaria]